MMRPNSRITHRPVRLLLVLAAALAATALGAWTARLWLDRAEQPRQATVLTPARALPPFELTDHHGAPFGPQRLEGRWSLLFFGFTHCPDICPVTLQTLAATARLLGERDTAPPQVVFVSVDPGRDTPQRLAAYLPHFDPRFVGVTGTAPAIDALTRSLGVAVVIGEPAAQAGGDGEQHYTVDHSAALFLIDPQGRWHAVFSAPHAADVIARDYAAITAG